VLILKQSEGLFSSTPFFLFPLASLFLSLYLQILTIATPITSTLMMVEACPSKAQFQVVPSSVNYHKGQNQQFPAPCSFNFIF